MTKYLSCTMKLKGKQIRKQKYKDITIKELPLVDEWITEECNEITR